MKRPLLLLYGCALACLPAAWTQDDFNFDLRPLDALLADATVHSPVLQLEQLNAELLYSDLRLLKKEWADYIYASASYQVGNVQFIDNLSGGSTPDVRTVTRENVFAVAGINVRLPLGDFVTKNERRRQLELRLDQQRLTLQQKEFELRQLVIRQYNDLQRALRVLEIRNRDVRFHVMAAETAERSFRAGDLDLDEYTSVHNKSNEAEIRLTEAQLNAQLLYLLLRELVGADIKA